MTRSVSRPFSLALSVALASLYMAGSAQAAQLGRLDILSASGQPLVAEIQVEKIAENERNGLVARLADGDAFKAARLDPSPLLSRLRFDLVPGLTADKAIIRITSSEPVPARFLDTLVEVSWAGGKLVREYTLALDRKVDSLALPNPVNAAPEQTTTAAPVTAPTAPTAAPVTPPAQQTAAPAPQAAAAPSQTPAPASPAAAQAGSAVVKKGDTLSELALSLVPQAQSPEQAMAALYQANPGAFINGSIHLIREGATLKVPDASSVNQQPRAKAIAVLRDHDDRTLSGMQRIAANPAKSKANSEGTTVTGAIESKPVEADAAPRQDQLKVGRARKEAGKPAEQANQNAEELIAKEKALKEANERIAILEKNVNDLQKLLELKSKTAEPPAEAAPVPKDAPAEKVEAPAAATEAPTEPPKPAQPPVVQAAAPVEAPLEEVAPKKVGMVQWLLGTPWILAGAGAGLATAAVMTLLLIRRKRANKQSPLDEAAADPLMDAPAPEPVQTQADVELPPSPLDDIFPPEPASTPEPARPEPPIPFEDLLDAPPELVQTNDEVELNFPEEPKEEAPKPSILDELDEMAQSTAAATEAIEQLREQTAQEAPEPETPESEEEPATDAIPAEQVEAAADEFDKAMADLDLDLPNPPIDESTWQEMATKLDLASAYVDIGDREGADDLLKEVISKGDQDQVRKARELQKSIKG